MFNLKPIKIRSLENFEYPSESNASTYTKFRHLQEYNMYN